MSFVKFVDFKGLSFSAYLETLLSMSPITTEGEYDANFYLAARGFKCIGHFSDIYPQHCKDYDFERYLVEENADGERLLIFDNESWDRTIDIICDPRDDKAIKVWMDEFHAEGLRQQQYLKDYQERCAKQLARVSLPTDLKEYDVHFTLEGRSRVSALSPDEAGDKINSEIKQQIEQLKEITDSYIPYGNTVTSVIDIFHPPVIEKSS